MKRPQELLLAATILVLILWLAPVLGIAQGVWAPLNTGTTANLQDVHFPVTNNLGYAVGDGGTIIKTTDGGAIWSPQTSTITATISAVNFADNDRGYAVSQGGHILITVDGGATPWVTPPGFPIPGLVLLDIQFPLGGATGYAVGGTGGVGIVLKTIDGGLSWAPVGVITQVTHLRSVHFPVSDSTGWVAGPSGTIAMTTDGGTTWTIQTTPTSNDLNEVFFADNSTGLAVGASGTVIRTTNGGTTWTLVPIAGATGDMPAVTMVGGVHAYAAESSGPDAVGWVWHSGDTGATWTGEVAALGTPLLGLSFAANEEGYAVGNGGAAAKRTLAPTPTPTATPTTQPATPTATPTTPPATPTATPTPPAPAPGPGLGNIKGVVFNDLNRNGSRDEGEPPIGGVGLRIDGGGDWSYATASAGDGSYEFCCLTKGTYYINASAPAGYQGTTALPLSIAIDGNSVTNANIGLAAVAAPTAVPTPVAAAPPIIAPPPVAEAPPGLPRTGTPPLSAGGDFRLALGVLLGTGLLVWHQRKRASLSK